MSFDSYARGRYRTGTPDLLDVIVRLEKRIKDLETANRLSFSSVGGGFIINGSPFKVTLPGDYFDDVTLLEVTTGTYNDKSSTEPGWVMRRNDGGEALGVYGNGSGQFFAVKDHTGNFIFSDDLFSGFGIGRPWLPIPFYNSSTGLPTATTTSGTFVELQYADYSVQSPYLYMQIQVHASDGTTAGEVQVTLSGNQVGDLITVTAGLSSIEEFGPALVRELATFGDVRDIKVMGRRTAGAGTIGVRVLGAYGRQS